MNFIKFLRWTENKSSFSDVLCLKFSENTRIPADNDLKIHLISRSFPKKTTNETIRPRIASATKDILEKVQRKSQADLQFSPANVESSLKVM